MAQERREDLRCAENLVTADLRSDDLGDDVAVGEANDESVLRGVVLVLGLGDQALAGIVVGLALLAALVLGLVPPEEVSSRSHGVVLVL